MSKDRRNKSREDRSDRDPSIGMAWKAFLILCVVWSALAAVFWLFGYDFTTDTGHRKDVCGFARSVLPQSVGEAVPCIGWKLGSFYIVPVLVLFFAFKRTLARS